MRLIHTHAFSHTHTHVQLLFGLSYFPRDRDERKSSPRYYRLCFLATPRTPRRTNLGRIVDDLLLNKIKRRTVI